MKKIILLFPGQGSQKVGMGKDVCDSMPEARQVFDTFDSSIDIKISQLCFEGPETDLTLTPNTQPAITAVNLALLAGLAKAGVKPVAAAGHSLGEYSAYAAAGVFDTAAAAKLTRMRGTLMQACADLRPGAMSAILGLALDAVDAACAAASAETGKVVAAANYNSPEQVVITGEKEAVARASALCSEKGAKKVVELKVSGAWHCKLLQDAQDQFAAKLDSFSFANPAFPVYANVDAQAKKSAAEVKDALVRQITSPVRWTQLIQAMRADFPDAEFVECGPGKVLRGLFMGLDRNAVCHNVEDAKSLAETLAKISG